jgi:hypothetical protein
MRMRERESGRRVGWVRWVRWVEKKGGVWPRLLSLSKGSKLDKNKGKDKGKEKGQK